MSTARPIDMWFHDACPIERNMAMWKHCPACGRELVHNGPNQAHCTGCDFDLPAMYRYCLRHR
ncbi:MAG: hypothetical protein ACYCW6_09400 [Candidatus Xenobia bacterium]